MDIATIGFAIIIGLLIQLIVFHALIRDATYAKDTRKKLDVMTKLLSEIALKQGVDKTVVEEILDESGRR